MNSAVRDEALRLYLLGWTAQEVANHCSVSVATIHAWIPKDKKRGQMTVGRSGEYVKGEDLARVMQDCMDTSDYQHEQRSAAGIKGGHANLGKLRSDGYNNRQVLTERREVPVTKYSPFTKMAEAIGMHESTLQRYYRNANTEWIEFDNADKVLTYLGAHWRFNVDVTVYLFRAGRELGPI